MRRPDTSLVLFTGALLVATAVGLSASPAVAQVVELETLPGYLPSEYLDLLAPGEASIEINLQGAMLRLISAFTGEEEPEFSRLVEALDGIRVRSGTVAEAELPALRQRLEAGRRWLDSHGWLTMVRFQESGEQVHVYTREIDGRLVGMAILALEASEVTTVNLVGEVDPAVLAHLAEGLDIGALEDVQERVEGVVD